jgi:hypothetical protein
MLFLAVANFIHKVLNILFLLGLSNLSIASNLSNSQASIWQNISSVYGPIIQAENGRLILNIIENPNSYANADRTGENASEYVIKITTGFLNNTKVTEGVFLVTLCHELGHFLGAPPYKAAPMDWTGPTTKNGELLLVGEGAADYFAGRNCLPTISKIRSPHSDVANLLQQVIDFLQLYGQKVSENVDAPEIVNKTITTYPTRQCRLNTFQNAFSNKPPPGCWFKE